MQIAKSVVPFDISFNRRCPGMFASPCPCIGFDESNYRECKFNSIETVLHLFIFRRFSLKSFRYIIDREFDDEMKNLYKLIFYEETHISGKDEQDVFDQAVKIAPRRLYMKNKIELIRKNINKIERRIRK